MQNEGSPAAEIRTFLIADVRGYTLFTQERGDEAAAKLASRFASLAREGVEARGGSVIELRGDEALAKVFASVLAPPRPAPPTRPARRRALLVAGGAGVVVVVILAALLGLRGGGTKPPGGGAPSAAPAAPGNLVAINRLTARIDR